MSELTPEQITPEEKQWLIDTFDVESRAELFEMFEMMKADYTYLRKTVLPQKEREAEERGRQAERATCTCLMAVPTEAQQIIGIDQYVCHTHQGRGVFMLTVFEPPTCCGDCIEKD